MDDKEYRSLFNKPKARSPSINSSNYRSSSSSYLNHMNTGSSFNKYDYSKQNIISSASRSSPINSYSTSESWNNNYYNYGASNNYSPSYSSTANSYLKKYDDDHSSSSKYGTKKNPQDDYSVNYSYLSKPYYNQYNEKTTLPSKYETKKYRQDDYSSSKLFNKNSYLNKDNEESSIFSKYETKKYRNEDFSSSFLHTANKYSNTDIGKSSFVNNSENKSDYFSKNPIVIANNDIKIGKPVNKIEPSKNDDFIQRQNVSKHEYNFTSDSSEVSDSQDSKHDIGEIIFVGKKQSLYHYLGKSGDNIVAINSAGNICYIPPDAIFA